MIIDILYEGIEGDQEWHTKEQGDFFTMSDSENLGSTDLFKDDGFDLIHKYIEDVHLSDLSPEESETAIPKGSKKVKNQLYLIKILKIFHEHFDEKNSEFFFRSEMFPFFSE